RISAVQSLDQHTGRVTVIHATVFFHLFNDKQQLQLGKIMAILLSLTPVTMLFGTHSSLRLKASTKCLSPGATAVVTCFATYLKHDDFCRTRKFPKGAVGVEAGSEELDCRFYMPV
ncbi:uncharacterized protein EV420DRAFT_1270099, partial [Desarmillaria tabescens]